MLAESTFKTIVSCTPLVSVDLIVKKEDKILLGKRVNRPAQGYFFTIGGRIYKDERLYDGISRVAREELNFTLEREPRFIGVFEHFYDDSIFEDVRTHYVNLGYEIEVQNLGNLPKEQHTEYKWFTLDELLSDEKVHPYVKDYFSWNKVC